MTHTRTRVTPPHKSPTPTAVVAQTSVSRTQILLWFVLVGFAWLALGVMVFGGVWPVDDRPKQIFLAGLSVIIGMLTYVPMEYYFHIRGLAVRGVLGLFLAVQIMLYVPTPQNSLLWVPDLPVYLLVSITLYWVVSTLCVPLTYIVGQLAFRQRARRYDVRRAWRQASEIGVLIAGLFGLFGLHALTPLLVIPWILMIVIAEILFLSFIEPPATR
ncbi:MAG: hypothetical protein EBS29_07030 [Chloroflexia bacterium]|nr:hypothetical protein [Chloroflexia bacterium]